MLISLSSINYSVGGKTLLLDASMVVNENDKVAIVGRNGSGKSTLLKILDGQLSLDAGSRDMTKGCRILLVRQDLPEDDISPIEFLQQIDSELQALYQRFDDADARYLEELNDAITMIEEDRYQKEAPRVLMGLGIDLEQQQRPMRELSGGLRMRIGLASALLQQPDLLLLDEPTNHLDLPSTIWLTEYLRSYPKPFVLVSHDRALLDTVVNTTYHLLQGKLTRYNGDFSIYLEQSALRQEQAILNNKNTDKRIAEIQQFVDTHKSNPKWARICRTREGWITDLDEGRLEITHEAPPIPIEFPLCAELRDPIIEATNCQIGYGDKTVLSNVNLAIQTRSRIGILGRNGEGKSTLVKMLVEQGVKVSGGLTIASRLRIGYFSQEQTDIMNSALSVLDQQKSVMDETITTEDVLTHLLKFGFKREQCTNLVGSLSGGEKTRLAFSMIAARCPHLIIMDEPTNHLDFETRGMLITAIQSYNGAVLLVSHDWELLNRTMQNYWMVRDGTVRPYPYDLTHYRKKILERSFTAESSARKAPAKSIFSATVTAATTGEANPKKVSGKTGSAKAPEKVVTNSAKVKTIFNRGNSAQTKGHTAAATYNSLGAK